MNQMMKKRFNRVIAMIMSLLIIFAMMPLNVFADETTSAVLTTDMEKQKYIVGQPTEFTFTTKANDDAGKMVRGYFVFSDTTAIEKLEYYETKDGNWYELDGAFGPESGFPIIDGTSKFRVTFKKAGDFSVTVSIKTVDGGTELCSATANIKAVKAFTYSVEQNEGGSVSLNGNGVTSNDTKNGSMSFEGVSTVSIKIKANEGYQIASLKVDGVSKGYEKFIGKTEATTEKKQQKDIKIEVVFVRVYTVTITSSGNGKIESTPDVKGGTVKVEQGTNIAVNAVPDKFYHVSRVVVNGAEDTSFESKNDVSYNKTFAADKDYTIEVTFAANIYNVTVADSKNGTVTSDVSSVEYNGSAKINIAPQDGYMVDNVTVNNTKVAAVTKDENGIYFTIDNINEDKAVAVTFKEIAKATNKDYKIDTSADLRPDAQNLVVIKDGTSVKFSTDKNGIRVIGDDGKVIGGNETAKEVAVAESATVTGVEVYYKAEGDYYAVWHTMTLASAMKIVLDKGDNVNVALVADHEANENGYYNSDIKFEVKAEDTGDYSGLALVEYWIVYNGKAEKKVTLYTHNDKDGIKNLYESDLEKVETYISIDSSKYNSDDIKFSLRAVDRAGNEQTVEKSLKINSTKPTVSLDIDGTTSPNAQESYYNDKRVLTITVGDREDTFSKQNAANGLKIKRDGANVPVNIADIEWTKKSDNIFEGKYTFETDGHYEWSFSYTNLAGLSNDGVKAPDDKFIYDFYVDKNAPCNLSISYSPTFVGVLIESLTYGFFKAPIEVTIEAEDAATSVECFEYVLGGQDEEIKSVGLHSDKVTVTGTDISRKGNKASVKFTISNDFRGKVSFAVTDKAGNTVEMTDNRIVVVDTIAPGVTVEFDNNDVYNGKYYNVGRTATIKIDEANFFQQDVEDGEHLKISRKAVYADGTGSDEMLKPKFNYAEGVYVAEIPFTEDAEYTFDIEYKDRAGNVYNNYPTKVFVVDTTAPVVNVSFDNNECVDGNKFGKARNATITVTERNFDFNNAPKATVNGEPYELKWNSVKGSPDKHEAVITFVGDKSYTFEVSDCYDLATNKSSGIDIGDSVAPWDFVIDESSPTDMKITYEPDFAGTLIGSLTYGFYKAQVKVTVEATDNESGIKKISYTYKEGQEETVDADGSKTVSTSFTIDPEYRGNVSFTATNGVNNSSTKTDANTIVIDTIAPGVKVAYKSKEVKNSIYSNKDVVATIIVDEANFFQQDLDDGLFVIKRKAVFNDETVDEQVLNPKFKFDEESKTYVSDVKFTEDAEYTFEIAPYTDRAGNTSEDSFSDHFVVDKTKPVISIEEMANGAYFNTDRTIKITVVEHNFAASAFEFTAEAYNVLGKSDKNKIDLSSKNYTDYLKNADNWTKTAQDTWVAEITFDINGNYYITAACTDLAGNEQKKIIEDSFCIDKEAPTDLTVTYEPTLVGTFITNATYGFYKDTIKVTISANDNISGVDKFIYSYTVDANATSVNKGKSNVSVAAKQVDGTDKYSATFDIPAMFRGKVSFDAIDKATNKSQLEDENVVVVDNVAPGVNVDYKNSNSFYDGYYKADRVATITIKEDNFFGTPEYGYADINEDYLVIPVGKTLNDGTYTLTKMKPEFSNTGDGIYTADISFDEDADYTFDIKYTDRSGNIYDSYTMDKFTVDKTKPIIEVKYKFEAEAYSNENCFRTDREATITITEHNFNAANVLATVTANGTEVERYKEYLKNPKNWTSDGDVHTATISFTEEAHYEFAIACTDMAGNDNDGVDYADSVAPTKFTIDKTAPTDLDIQISNVSVAGSMTTLAFNRFYSSAVKVELSANCDISGRDSFKYQKVANASDYSESGNWVDYNDENGIVVAPSEKFVLYFRAEDRAGNVSIIRSTGIVVDNQKPIGETNAPEIDILPEAGNANGIYNKNVSVNLKVVDPMYDGSQASSNGYYSGLNTITYRIYTTDTNAMEAGILFKLGQITNGAVFDDDKLVSSWTGGITVNAAKFNSNNVIVEVTATDNAGNTRITTTYAGQIKIDTVAPKIDVSYNNNSADSGSYFKANRTATIVVTERNFNAKDVKVYLTNKDGSVPTLSGWSKTAGTGNMDNTKWTATIVYSNDGEYSFGMEYTDLAGWTCGRNSVNYGTSVAPTKFTVDKSAPSVMVSYDNNNARNGNYYNANRTATVVIVDRNFTANRVSVMNTATNDGAEIAKPTVSGWTSNGNKHTATISYNRDGRYTFDIAVTDKAGNTSGDYTEETFFVDTTKPTLEITGVADKSANNGNVVPVVSYSDTNYDPDGFEISLTGANRKSVAVNGSYSNIHNGRVFTFANFAKEKAVDDIYTLSAVLTDKAGNSTSKTITFSVNRFGSTYALSDSSAKLNGTYVKSPIDVIITETNTDSLSDIKVTLFKDDKSTVLKNGTDFDIMAEGGNGQWYHYTYTIFAKNFADDGVYSITVESNDKAGNAAKNDQDTKNTTINFGVDSTLPKVIIANLESKTTYALDNLTVKMNIKDNLKLTKVFVVLDGNEVKRWEKDELDDIIKNGGNFSFDISGASTEAHNLVVYAVDAAGNGEKISDINLPANVEKVEDFYITTNLWIRYYTNKPLFFGSIAGVAVVAGLIVFLVARKKRED